MATLTTPNLGLPYPNSAELLKDVPAFIQTIALALDKGKVLPTFASVGARTTGIPSPVVGALTWMTDLTPMARLEIWDGSTWKRVYPPITQVGSGSAAPTGTAEAGQLYIQT
jgi:hypothetical protein